jgi:hypothetical protein
MQMIGIRMALWKIKELGATAPWFAILFIFLAFVNGLFSPRSAAQSAPPQAILVELFTSEGCSSCPPADALLRQLDRTQPVPGAQLIVLSEHVDYWNHIGWADPFSSSFFSNRQAEYARHFGLDGPYTPQMIVDGTSQLVGNDRRAAQAAMEKAREASKIQIRLSDVSWNGAGTLRAHLEAGPFAGKDSAQADVFFAAALDHAESQVLRGENEGRRLIHVAVVLRLIKVGTLEKGGSFSRDVQIALARGQDPTNLRAIAFVQERGPSRVLGADMRHVAAGATSPQASLPSRHPSIMR